MIDEYWTWIFYGYHSDELKPKSNKLIVARCDGCCQYRVLRRCSYRDFCLTCKMALKETRNNISKANTGKTLSDEHKNKISEKMKGRVFTDEWKRKLSDANRNRKHPPVSDEARRNMSIAGKGRVFTEEHKRKISESNKGKVISEEQRHMMSINATGRIATPEARHNMSEAAKGRIATDEARSNMSKAQKGKMVTEEARQHISAGKQGVPYEEWTGFVSNGEYCEKFDEACRERIRAKYDHRCFVCGRPQDENITKTRKTKKLSVHHANKNKMQGCDGSQWKLVPLCMSCHSKSHTQTWVARINYLLEFVWI